MIVDKKDLKVIYDCSFKDNNCEKVPSNELDDDGNRVEKYVDIQVRDRAFIQQTFLGASIMDFSVSLGLNSASSTLSLRLVEDDLNYGTETRKYRLRDAVSEGYHPWNRNAFPEGLVFNTALNHIIGQDDEGNDIGYPNYGVLPVGELPDGDNSNVKLDTSGAKGDIFFPPKTGDPVFFKYYLPKELKEECVKEETESSAKVFDDETYGVCKKTDKDDAEEMTQEVKDENGNSPDNEEDCAEVGGTWDEDSSKCNIGLNKTECEEQGGHWVPKSRNLGCDTAFEFNGIFKKYEKTYGTSGVVYNVEVTDPRGLLENTTVILKDIAHRTAPADAWVTSDSHRRREKGFKGQANVLNVFGYYESVNLGNSAVNDAGFVWYDHERKLKKENGQDLINPYQSEHEGWGILSALDTMLNNHYWSEFDDDELPPGSILDASGMNVFGGDGLFSEYVANGEPFGGPLYYGHDDRANTDPAPLAERSRNPYILKYGSRNHVHIHRYKVDLTDLAELSIDKNPGECFDQNGIQMDVPEYDFFYKDKPEKWRCEHAGGLWRDAGTLPFDFRINADKISLLALIEQVCTSAGADFFVSLERPDRNVKKEENFSGVIKVTPIFRNRSLVNPVQSEDIITKFKERNYLSAGIDLALDKEKPLGPFTKPLFEKGHPKYKEDQRQSILSSASLGYEFGDPKTGVILYGAKRTRMVGITHLGDRGFDPYYNYSSFFKPSELFTPGSRVGGFPATDLAYEYLPSTEVDGVTLRHQTLNRLVAKNGKVAAYRDDFYEMENELTEQEPEWIDGVKTMVDVTYAGYTWNDYGDEYESKGSCSDDQYDNKESCEAVEGNTWKEEGYSLSNIQSLFKDYQRSGAHYSNDNYLPFYHWKDFQFGSVSVEDADPDDAFEDKTFLPEQLNRINSKFIRDRVEAAGSCEVSSAPNLGDVRDKSFDERVELDTQEKCERYGFCGLPEDNPEPMREAVCDAQEGEHEWTQLKWTPQNGSARSGYLDIYPCWGFEQKVVKHGTYSNAFDDIIDIKVEQEPIKGMYWDDDPYRDFHPSEGIFSVFEFYNPGLGQCIRVSCDKNANSAKCFSKEGDEIENIPAGDNAPATEETCRAAGTCQVIGGREDNNTESSSTQHSTEEECLEQKNPDGTPKNEWISVNKWVNVGDAIDGIFTDETAAIKVCETYGGKNNTVFEDFANNEKLCTCNPLSPFRGPKTEFGLDRTFVYTDPTYLTGPANPCQTGWRDTDPSLVDYLDFSESGGDPNADPPVPPKVTVTVNDIKAFVPKFKWESFCTINSTCTASDGSEVTELHINKLGTGNEIHKQKGGCEKACFEAGVCLDGTGNILDEFTESSPCEAAGHVWQNPDNSEGAIVAYFLIDFQDGTNPDKEKRGMPASKAKTPKAFEGSFSAGNNDIVQLVLDKTTCEESLAGINTNKRYQYVPINSSGEIAAEGEENKFSSTGGPYSAKCDAMSMHSPYYEQCLHTEGEFEGLPAKYQKVDQCLEAKLKGEKVDWKLNEIPDTIEDHYYGKVVERADHPEPGYISPRYRITKGNCITEVTVEGEEGETSEQTTIAEIDDTYRPKTKRDPDYSIAQDCYKATGGKAKMDYSEVDKALEHLWQPRTATIPIRIEGYGGGSPTSNEIGGETNQFDLHMSLNGDNHYYMATVTELRHAAISFESWKSYLRAFAPHLPCYMYAKNPFFSSAWSDLCPVVHKEIRMGIGRASVDALRSVVSGLSRGLPKMTFTDAQNHLVSKKGDAEKLSGAVKKKKGELTDYEESKMQLDMAYKAVRDVATNFYGRKFLVPLPVIPPKENFCSGYSAKKDEDASSGESLLEKDVRYDNQEDCEAAGFEWGAHPDLSKMLNSSKTTEDKNNWEIVNSAWPGGEVNLNKDDNGSYPTNLNFWSDDGNLRAFAVFPEKITNRMNEQTQDVGFNNYDPEKIQMSNYKILEDFENIEDLEIKKLADAFGGKVYVEIDVDPKIYWLHDRSYAERYLGQQYFMHETGNVTLQNPGDKRHLHDYVKIGTETAKTVVDDRSIWSLHDLNDPEAGKTTGICLDSEGTEVLDDPPLTKDTCEQTEGNEWYPANTITQTNVGESGPKRPYALITLPEKIFYQENDRVKKTSGNPFEIQTEPAFKLGFEVPLSETKNSEDLFLAWTFQQIDDSSVALRNIERILNNRTIHSIAGIDVDRASMIAAAMKPWHASIPQESNLYRWGPWVTDFGFGRTEFDIDASYHPAAFGGEKILYKAATDHIYATKENHVKKSFESGSITLASGPEHKLGSQAEFDFPTNIKGQEIDFKRTLGAYVTDIAVDVGENGISTRYGFNSQSRFGDLQAIYEERLRKSQKDMIRSLKKQEEDQRRTKRNIKEFKD